MKKFFGVVFLGALLFIGLGGAISLSCPPGENIFGCPGYDSCLTSPNEPGCPDYDYCDSCHGEECYEECMDSGPSMCQPGFYPGEGQGSYCFLDCEGDECVTVCDSTRINCGEENDYCGDVASVSLVAEIGYGRSQCTPCPIGTYGTDGLTCESCPSNTDEYGATSCTVESFGGAPKNITPSALCPSFLPMVCRDGKTCVQDESSCPDGQACPVATPNRCDNGECVESASECASVEKVANDPDDDCDGLDDDCDGIDDDCDEVDDDCDGIDEDQTKQSDNGFEAGMDCGGLDDDCDGVANICDGHTCSDGSCVATADDCLQSAQQDLDPVDNDCDGLDDDCDGAKATDYNSSRSNKQGIVGDRCDGITCPDGSCQASSDMCEDMPVCSEESPFLCPDGSCREGLTACSFDGVDAEVSVEIAGRVDSFFDVLFASADGGRNGHVTVLKAMLRDMIDDADDAGEDSSLLRALYQMITYRNEHEYIGHVTLVR